jgi:hypothetical protein
MMYTLVKHFTVMGDLIKMQWVGLVIAFVRRE